MRKLSKKLLLKLAAVATVTVMVPQMAMAVYVPEALKPWTDWVLHTHKQATCAMVEGSNAKQCVTYADSKIDIVTTKGAAFQMSVKVLANNTQVILPGQTWAWPSSVTVNSQPRGTSAYRNLPAVRLDKGTYTIAGQINWDNTPAYLQLPADLAQVQFTLNGKTLDMPQLRGDRLVLQKSRIEPIQRDIQVEQNTSKLQVFRLVTDSIPAQITTQMRLTVTGAEREITIPNFHLANTEPAAYSGRLPVKRQNDGSYVVQAGAGVHSLTFTDLYKDGRMSQLTMPELPWTEEVWAFNPMPELRLVDTKAETPLNPDQTDIPNHWRNFAAYLMHAGESIDFDIVREGAPHAPDNALNLNRTMWLAQDGHQFTVRDMINGTMNTDWRLDQAANVDLGRVNIQGKAQPLTRGANDREGVEVRQQYMNLEAISILPVSLLPVSAPKLPIGSWNTDFENASASVIMPNAWRPITVTGADKTRGTWMSQWNLYQFFFLLLTTAVAFRLWGSAKWAGVAFLALALTMHDHATLLTQVLVLLVFGLVLAALPKEAKLYKSVNTLRGFVLAVVVLLAVPFTLLHVQNALYPHLAKEALFSINVPGLNQFDGSRGVVAKSSRSDMVMEQNFAAPETAPVPRQLRAAPMLKMGGGNMALNAMAMDEMKEEIMPTASLTEIDPNTRVPTGPGLPEWRQKQNSVSLNWAEGVTEGETFRLWMLSPFGFRLLELLKVLAFGLLLAKLFKTDLCWPRFKGGKKAAAAALLTVGMLNTAPAMAQDMFPPQHLLKDLEKRLLEPAACAPNCAFAEKAALQARGDSITLTFTFTAEEEVLAQLPTLKPVVFPSNVVVNNVNAFTVAHQNRPYVLLPKGRSTVAVRYDAGDYNNLNLDLGQTIAAFDNSLVGWRIGGLNTEGNPNGRVVSLSRTPEGVRAPQKQDKKAEKPTYKPLEFAGYAKVHRHLAFNNNWEITTRIMLEHGAPFTLDLPLLEGEKLLETQHDVKNGKVRLQVSHRPIVLRSEIEPTEALTLVAADDKSFREVWQLGVSTKWHVAQESGVAPIMHQQNGMWQPEWQPYGGDEVTLSIKKPMGIDGQELTIHNGRIESALRGKTQVNTLTLNIETTRPQTHNVTLGRGLKLKEFYVNGRALSQAAADEGELLEVGLPLRHGMNNARIVWEETEQNLLHIQTPEVNLNAPFVNLTQSISDVSKRWVVWTYGPANGPYVKLWAVLAGMIILAWVMAKALPAPLSFAGWFVLALGFTQSAPEAFLLPVLWIMLLQWREKHGEKLNRVRFNATQIGVVIMSIFVVSALFTVVKVGLLGTPEVYIEGNHSTTRMLQWYQDTGTNTPAEAGACTLPMWVFRVLMMAWALWVALWLMRTFKWAWHSFTAGGYWKKRELTQNK